MANFRENSLYLYLAKFFGAFCLLFYGTEAIIGLSSPENSYSPFVANYLDFISPLRYSLLFASKLLLQPLGYETFLKDQYTLSLPGGSGVRMVYSCIGYGVMSFWAAFIFANNGSFKKKAAWILLGWAALYIINVIRISLLLVATNRHWVIPLGWDHHTWFNIAAYGLIFAMIWVYDRGGKKALRTSSLQVDEQKIWHEPIGPNSPPR